MANQIVQRQQSPRQTCPDASATPRLIFVKRAGPEPLDQGDPRDGAQLNPQASHALATPTGSNYIPIKGLQTSTFSTFIIVLVALTLLFVGILITVSIKRSDIKFKKRRKHHQALISHMTARQATQHAAADSGNGSQRRYIRLGPPPYASVDNGYKRSVKRARKEVESPASQSVTSFGHRKKHARREGACRRSFLDQEIRPSSHMANLPPAIPLRGSSEQMLRRNTGQTTSPVSEGLGHTQLEEPSPLQLNTEQAPTTIRLVNSVVADSTIHAEHVGIALSDGLSEAALPRDVTATATPSLASRSPSSQLTSPLEASHKEDINDCLLQKHAPKNREIRSFSWSEARRKTASPAPSEHIAVYSPLRRLSMAASETIQNGDIGDGSDEESMAFLLRGWTWPPEAQRGPRMEHVYI